VAWIGIQENPLLLRAFGEIENAAVKTGFAAEQRNFQGHITIARIKGRVNREWIDLLKNKSEEKFGIFQPEEFTLYRSELKPNGPEYSRIAFFPCKEA
jgi:2'-5' RNA ligase